MQISCKKIDIFRAAVALQHSKRCSSRCRNKSSAKQLTLLYAAQRLSYLEIFVNDFKIYPKFKMHFFYLITPITELNKILIFILCFFSLLYHVHINSRMFTSKTVERYFVRGSASLKKTIPSKLTTKTSEPLFAAAKSEFVSVIVVVFPSYRARYHFVESS